MANRILVVEDNDDSRSMLVVTLTGFYGYETIETATGAEAVEKAISEKPALILMDLGLPDISGVDAAKALKKDPSTAHIPIIAYTAWPSNAWKAKTLKAGMVDYLEKPVRVELMKEIIKKIHPVLGVEKRLFMRSRASVWPFGLFKFRFGFWDRLSLQRSGF